MMLSNRVRWLVKEVPNGTEKVLQVYNDVLERWIDVPHVHESQKEDKHE